MIFTYDQDPGSTSVSRMLSRPLSLIPIVTIAQSLSAIAYCMDLPQLLVEKKIFFNPDFDHIYLCYVFKTYITE